MNCAIYVRVSTDEQAREGFSIAAQKERLKAFCQSQGWEITEMYVEEGASAKDLNRPVMKRLLLDVKKNKFDLVLVYRLDRLTRSVLDLYNLLQTFEKYNVAFKSATEVYDTSTAMGRLFITLVAALAQWERENLAERVKFGIFQMIDEGKKPGGHNLYGYKYNNGELKAEIVEEEAQIVRKIFSWYAEGYGYRSIARRLDAAGIKPRMADQWTSPTIRQMLTNRMYIGHYKWGDKVVEGSHESIIDDDLFHMVQQIMSGKHPKDSRKGKYPLTGILKCGHCDEYPITGTYDKRDNKMYYRCLSCKRQTHEQKIVPPLLQELEKLVSDKQYFLSKVKSVEPDAPDVRSIQKEIDKVKAQKSKWYDVFEDPESPINKEDLYEKIRRLNDQELQLQEQLLQVDIEEDPDYKFNKIKQMTDIVYQYNNTDSHLQKELMNAIFEKVIIKREKGRNKPTYIDYVLR